MVEPWFWSEIDEDAPFGNDTGADTLAYFSEWRRVTPLKSTFQFLESLFRRWAIERAQDLILSEAELSEQLPVRYFHILVGDDAIVATAFAQLAIEGRIEPTLSVSADSALSRQMLNPVVAFRDWVDPSERRHRVARMLEVIRSVRAEG